MTLSSYLLWGKGQCINYLFPVPIVQDLDIFIALLTLYPLYVLNYS